eukprot:SAG31_NODE_271_length_18717_cov_8.685949_17_plen_449_part_00
MTECESEAQTHGEAVEAMREEHESAVAAMEAEIRAAREMAEEREVSHAAALSGLGAEWEEKHAAAEVAGQSSLSAAAAEHGAVLAKLAAAHAEELRAASESEAAAAALCVVVNGTLKQQLSLLSSELKGCRHTSRVVGERLSACQDELVRVTRDCAWSHAALARRIPGSISKYSSKVPADDNVYRHIALQVAVERQASTIDMLTTQLADIKAAAAAADRERDREIEAVLTSNDTIWNQDQKLKLSQERIRRQELELEFEFFRRSSKDHMNKLTASLETMTHTVVVPAKSALEAPPKLDILPTGDFADNGDGCLQKAHFCQTNAEVETSLCMLLDTANELSMLGQKQLKQAFLQHGIQDINELPEVTWPSTTITIPQLPNTSPLCLLLLMLLAERQLHKYAWPTLLMDGKKASQWSERQHGSCVALCVGRTSSFCSQRGPPGCKREHRM